MAALGQGARVSIVEEIENLFPGLQGSTYRITSPRDDSYNCIAWAAGDTQSWWWPAVGDNLFWPGGVPGVETLPAFQQAFESLGYAVCPTEDMEAGFEKIALFADAQGLPLHAARQLPDGRWTSKLGELEDIEHALRDLEGAAYGTVALLMKRPQTPGA